MAHVPVTYTHLAPNPKSSYKQLFIRGTRIRAEAIYAWTVDGGETSTPEQIAADFGLPLEAVLEAIAYCRSNPPEIEQDHRREEARIAATGVLEPKHHDKPGLLPAQETERLEKP